MKQLSGLDASFLYMETPTTLGHVSGLAIYSPVVGDQGPYELFKDRVRSRLGLLDPFRRRLAMVPFDLDHPYWIEDPDFDLDFHLRHIAVPAPGNTAELNNLVARIIARPLDRSRPLWEAYVIEGLPDEKWAVLTKVHHATIDGASGNDLLTILLDNDELDDNIQPPPPEAVPTPAEMLAHASFNMALRPLRMARASQRFFAESMQLANKRDPAERFTPKPYDATTDPAAMAPPSPFNRAIGPHRRFAWASASLDDIKALKNVTSSTVNDVVMAVCAGGLRRYLQAHDHPLDRPLVAGVPVSTRTGDEDDIWSNRVSMVRSNLPVHLESPLERLAACHLSMAKAKEEFAAVPADALQDFSQFSPPAVFTTAARMGTQFRFADRSPSAVNLIVSNVPGPRTPLSLGGAALDHYVPVSTIGEGLGLNITVLSYTDFIDFSVVSCRDLVPDLDDLLQMIMDELAEMLAATEELRTASPS